MSLLQCDPFGIIGINDSSPPFMCALWNYDNLRQDATVTQDIASCCSPYYPAQSTNGNGCDVFYCGLPAYHAIDTVTSTNVRIPYPTAGEPRSTVTSITTGTYEAIVGYPRVSQCLESVALWAENRFALACQVGGDVGEVSFTGPETISSTRAAALTATRVDSSITGTAATGTPGASSGSVNRRNHGLVWLALASCLVLVGQHI